jgi:hypothetical protein
MFIRNGIQTALETCSCVGDDSSDEPSRGGRRGPMIRGAFGAGRPLPRRGTDAEFTIELWRCWR